MQINIKDKNKSAVKKVDAPVDPSDYEEKKEKKTPKGPGVSDSKNDGQGAEVIPTSDYKINAAGKKYKAHRIVFNKGEDDGTKGVSEEMKKTYKAFAEQHREVELTEEQLDEMISEVLSKDATAGEWIHDFVHSDNPKFAGKSKEKRKQMALAAYYATQRNEEVEQIDELAGEMHPEADKVLKHIKPEHHSTYKPWLKKGVYKGDYKDRSDVLNAAKKAGHLKEEAEQIDEDFCEIMEAYDPEDYEATHEKSQFGGYRAKLVHKTKGHTSYLGGTAYHKPEHAEGEAKTYRDNYRVGSGKAQPGASMSQDRAVSDYRKKAQALNQVRESVWDWKNKPREIDMRTSTATAHDVKKTSTGTQYTKKHDDAGMNKEFKRDPNAAKRGRGRPKKNVFGEAVDFLLSLSEEQFDDFMSEGFDTFFESYDQLDELSKDTLKSYAARAAHSAVNKGAEFGSRHATADEVDRFTNRHMNDKHGENDRIKKAVGADRKSVEDARMKAMKRVHGIKQAVDRLTK